MFETDLDLSPEKIAAIAAAAVLALIFVIIVLKISPKRLRPKRFIKKWRKLQAKCSNPEDWPEVLSEADKLLDEALKKRRIKGKTTGERMVSAQKLFTDNDSVWFAHKLYKKVQADPTFKLTQQQMKKALVGVLQGLKDLGAIKK